MESKIEQAANLDAGIRDIQKCEIRFLILIEAS